MRTRFWDWRTGPKPQTQRSARCATVKTGTHCPPDLAFAALPAALIYVQVLLSGRGIVRAYTIYQRFMAFPRDNTEAMVFRSLFSSTE